MDTSFTDQIITCRDCRQPFTHSARDQEFYASRDFTPPRSCRDCRAFRKAQREEQQVRS